MIVCGIDPGNSGAVAFLRGSELDWVEPLPVLDGEPIVSDLLAVIDAFGPPRDVFVAIEEPFANPSAARKSIATQFFGYGVLVGAVVGAGYRHERVAPRDWKQELGLPQSSKLTPRQRKDASRAKATQLWPGMADQWATHARNGHAEAALIAEATRRRLKL